MTTLLAPPLSHARFANGSILSRKWPQMFVNALVLRIVVMQVSRAAGLAVRFPGPWRKGLTFNNTQGP